MIELSPEDHELVAHFEGKLKAEQEKLGLLQEQLGAAEAERGAAFARYNPNDTKASALAEVERASAKVAAIQHQVNAQRAAVDELAATTSLRVEAVDRTAFERRASVVGLAGWRAKHAAALERIAELSTELRHTIARTLADADHSNEGLDSLRVHAREKGYDMPEPASPMTIGKVLAEFRITYPDPVEWYHARDQRCESVFVRDLLARFDRLVAHEKVGRLPARERARRLDAYLNREAHPNDSRRTDNVFPSGRPPLFTDDELAVLGRAIAARGALEIAKEDAERAKKNRTQPTPNGDLTKQLASTEISQ